jgi:hypothetical protein
MRSMRVLAAMALVVSIGTHILAQGRGEAVVDGVVKDEQGDPVAGVAVSFLMGGGNAVQGKSDSSGRWRVIGLAKGEWRALFVAKGYVTQATVVLVKSEDAASILVPIVLKRAVE